MDPFFCYLCFILDAVLSEAVLRNGDSLSLVIRKHIPVQANKRNICYLRLYM